MIGIPEVAKKCRPPTSFDRDDLRGSRPGLSVESPGTWLSFKFAQRAMGPFSMPVWDYSIGGGKRQRRNLKPRGMEARAPRFLFRSALIGPGLRILQLPRRLGGTLLFG